jgi:hypothetical protein
VVSVLSDTGRQSLSVRYSAYGVPFGSPAGDLNADGPVDSTDQTLLAGDNYGLTLGRGKLAAGQTSGASAPGIPRWQ